MVGSRWIGGSSIFVKGNPCLFFEGDFSRVVVATSDSEITVMSIVCLLIVRFDAIRSRNFTFDAAARPLLPHEAHST